jgi:hypothetical protein
MATAAGFKPASIVTPCMPVEIVPPTERRCETCGRQDVWDDTAENWVIAERDGDRQIGNPNCIHEWDINGRYNPVREMA